LRHSDPDGISINAINRNRWQLPMQDRYFRWKTPVQDFSVLHWVHVYINARSKQQKMINLLKYWITHK
jgi:hypothetical protein